MTKRHGAVFLFVFLLIFWIILSFKVDLVIVCMGALASMIVVFYNFDLIFNKQQATKLTLRTIGRLIVLFVVLILNITKSNIEVAKIVLSRKMDIDPGFETIRQPLKKELNQALFANAITLTPGTLTIDMDQTSIVVHGLKKSYAKGIEGSQLEQVFVAFEGAEK